MPAVQKKPEAIRSMPHNLEAEQSVLGCVLFDESISSGGLCAAFGGGFLFGIPPSDLREHDGNRAALHSGGFRHADG